MARIQILELPVAHVGEASETPFILIIDQVDDETAADIARWPDNIASRTGARHVLCFSETVDIPANQARPDADGQPPLGVHIEGEFERFRGDFQEEIRKALATLKQTVAKG